MLEIGNDAVTILTESSPWLAASQALRRTPRVPGFLQDCRRNEPNLSRTIFDQISESVQNITIGAN